MNLARRLDTRLDQGIADFFPCRFHSSCSESYKRCLTWEERPQFLDVVVPSPESNIACISTLAPAIQYIDTTQLLLLMVFVYNLRASD